MRRREKFVLSAIFLSLGLMGVQYTTLDYRYLAVGIFTLVTYLVSTWALSDDLQRYERFTVVPFPAFYALAVSLFYFLLPANILSQLVILILFGIGMYAIYLSSNIFSVAKGRTIQLLHAAHAIHLLFTLLISLLFSNTIFSLRLPFFANGLLVGLVHFPLIFMSLWAVRLEEEVQLKISILAGLMTLLLIEFGMIFSFYPLSVWYSALFVMSVLYLGLGILHNYLRGRLFERTMREYSLVAIFIAILFFISFPLK